jgi:ABC-type lipoprotein export system ATPase subunit
VTEVARCIDVVVQYGEGAGAVRALDGVSVSVESGDRLALRGRSGSGKTTLLHVLGGLVRPSQGKVERRAHLAYVFQGSNLLPTFDAFENVAFAALNSGNGDSAGERDPLALLQLVGLAEKADQLPDELSGGERQRVALARALAQRPTLLLCDEPTGQLDSDTGERVLDLIDALQREYGFALVTATHDEGVAARHERVLELEEGRVVAKRG